MDFIDEIIKREGSETNDPLDSGGRTKFGISEKAHPEAWADGDVSKEEARSIYEKEYVEEPHFDKIPDLTLEHQVIDHGVMSGQEAAAKILQQILGVKIDGVLGPETFKAIANYPDGTLFGTPVSGKVLLNVAFRDARIMHYAIATKIAPKNLKFLLGWIQRAQEFK